MVALDQRQAEIGLLREVMMHAGTADTHVRRQIAKAHRMVAAGPDAPLGRIEDLVGPGILGHSRTLDQPTCR
jgi:hypothetical protein